MTDYFITGSGTGVGKTFVTAALAHAMIEAGHPVQVAKPIISGFTMEAAGASDTGLLLEASRQPLSPQAIEACSPWRFLAPLSPDMAAAREGRIIDFDVLVEWTRTCRGMPASRPQSGTRLLIEGVGGVMVPLDDRHTVLDWIAASSMPAILVVGSYLGTISHTLCALSVLAARAIPVASIIISESAESPVPLAETATVIERFSGGVPVCTLPRMTDWRDVTGRFSTLI